MKFEWVCFLVSILVKLCCLEAAVNRGGYHYTIAHKNELVTHKNAKNLRHHYRLSQPKAIDDPLPEKVNYLTPIVVDFPSAFRDEVKPLFTPVFAPSSLTPNEEMLPPIDKYRAKEPQKESLTETTTSAPQNPKTEDIYKTENQYPAKFSDIIDLEFINHHHGPETGFELFNVHDETPLTYVKPEVIFKPGDDTSFANDLTVFDDYEHVFTPKNTTNLKFYKTNSNSNSTTQSPNEHGDNNSKESLKSIENHDSFQGYVYEKPAIEFNT
ncbi:uncharacterized protein LOC101899216 [Musca domestica]|uniref:Uncharacterized protein LOC101899216 n=1 Tax=Musca domestica TaxID=7370 RepID=A0A1I8MCB7_MUSDO|nr:uncharacterized protein LOC101899216 [Musca domestica]